MLETRFLYPSLVLLFVFFVNNTQATEEYRFERMFPVLQQPWYFGFLQSVSLDSDGNIYVADSLNSRVMKLNSHGRIITSKSITLDDYSQTELLHIEVDSDNKVLIIANLGDPVSPLPTLITLDIDLNIIEHVFLVGAPHQISPTQVDISEQYIYLYNQWGDRVFRFAKAGNFLGSWSSGAGPSSNASEGMKVLDDGNISIFAAGIISTFTPTGELINQVDIREAVHDSSPGSLTYTHAIAQDENGLIYGCNASDIFKFSSTGNLLDYFKDLVWNEFDFGCYNIEIFKNRELTRLAISQSTGILIVSEHGDILNYFGTGGTKPLMLKDLNGVAIGSNGAVYLLDLHDIVKTDLLGRTAERFTTQARGGGWRLKYFNQNLFMSYYSPSLDEFHIQTLNEAVENVSDIVLQLESLSGGGSDFIAVLDFAVNHNGDIFTTSNTGNSTPSPNAFALSKFDNTGKLVNALYFSSNEIGVFAENPIKGLAIDTNGKVVANFKPKNQVGGEIRFYDENLVLVDQFSHSLGEADCCSTDVEPISSFSDVGTIAIDSNNRIAIKAFSNQIHVLSRNGELVQTFGDVGVLPGQFGRNNNYFDFDDNNNLLLGDRTYNRVQKFSLSSITDNTKAIVVAAGGPFAGNNLWDTTQLSANFAYRALTYQGFTKDSIYYLSSDTDLDLDLNGLADDVDADATNANLEYAIKEWASDADNLTIYLVDHGGVNTFRMSGTEVLQADELAEWVNQLQTTMPGRVTFVYDACESGTFMSALQPPPDVERTIITSTSPGENAVFISQGSISFSNYFWTHVFNGLSLEDSFSLASQALTSTTDHQHPMLDYNGDGFSDGSDLAAVSQVFIGNGTDLQASAPEVFAVTSDQVISGTSTATIDADGVFDDDGVARVWAIARPPDYTQGASGNPVQELPSFDLRSQGGGNYSGTWDQFTTAGTYQLAIYATDRIGNTSVPLLTTVSVDSPLSKRAILIAAGASNDPEYEIASSSTDVAYEALKQQGYDDEAIYYMSSIGTAGVDGSPSVSNLEFAITGLDGEDTQDLVVYIVGGGERDAISINDTETLTPSQLANWLNTLTDSVPGNVTVVLDGDHSGSFISALGNNKRIVVTSTSAEQKAHFFSDGDISFSKYYWRKVFNGSTVRDAWVFAKRAMRFSVESQEAQLDDDGDGVSNTKQDGDLAEVQAHGAGILLAGDEPSIGSISATQSLTVGSNTTIVVNEVITTGEISSVVAIVTAPDGSLSTHTMGAIENGYSTDGMSFSLPGTYDVAVYAQDGAGNLSLPISTTVEVTRAGFELALNSSQTSYRAGQTLSLSTEATIGTNRTYTDAVDVYLSLTLPDGTIIYLADLTPTISTGPQPILQGWSPSSIPDTPILSVPLPEGLTPGDYSWKLTLTRAGQSITDSGNWLAQGRAVHGFD